jgi:outer membrane protein assembly factor BamB
MKKIVIAVLLVFSIVQVHAQEFPTVWKGKFSFKPDRWRYSGDGKYVMGRDETQAEMLDGTTGKQIWKINFKNDLNVKELTKSTDSYKGGVLLLFNRDEKKKKGEKVVIDWLTGKELWRTDSYPGTDGADWFHFAHCLEDFAEKGTVIAYNEDTHKITGFETRTGKIKWESKAYPDLVIKNIAINAIEDSEYAEISMIKEEDKIETTYMNVLSGEIGDPTKFVSVKTNYTRASENRIVFQQVVGETVVKLVGRMKPLSIDKISFTLSATGNVTWFKQFEGRAVSEIFTHHPYVKMDVQGDKILVLSKNITVFDLKTGNQLWQAPFDNCDTSIGMKAKQEFGIAGWPLVDGAFIYYVDLQNDNAIKKVEGATGKIVWKSEKIKSNDRVPNLVILNGVLVAQFGGMINTQTYISTSEKTVTKNENRFDGDYGVRAYDAATGALIWSSSKLADKLGDKFSDRISSIYGMGNKIVVASDKNVFSLDAKTGEVVYKTPLSPSKVGDAVEMIFSEDGKKLTLFCDNGVASLEPASGKLNYATVTDEIFWKAPGSQSYTFTRGENFFIWVGEKDFIGFNLVNGSIKGKMKDVSNPQLTDDGNQLFVRDGDKITKYNINK